MKKRFQISTGSALIKRNVFLKLNNRAYGEAACSIYYGPSENEIMADVDKGIEHLQHLKLSVTTLEELNELEINSISKAALTTVLLHYLSASENKYPWQILELDEPPQIITSFTIGIDKIESMTEEIMKSPFAMIKIKMGFDGDENLIPELKKISGKVFRVDANGGWNLDKAEKMINMLDKIGVEIIEQPTKVDNIKNWKYLKGRARASLIIDEGLNSLLDYACYADYVDGINIKMSKSGGVIEGMALALQARKDKLKVMLGCMLESSIGISPAVYLSSLADYFDLDGPLLLENDPAIGLKYDVDNIIVDSNIIGGPKLRDEIIK